MISFYVFTDHLWTLGSLSMWLPARSSLGKPIWYGLCTGAFETGYSALFNADCHFPLCHLWIGPVWGLASTKDVGIYDQALKLVILLTLVTSLGSVISMSLLAQEITRRSIRCTKCPFWFIICHFPDYCRHADCKRWLCSILLRKGISKMLAMPSLSWSSYVLHRMDHHGDSNSHPAW